MPAGSYADLISDLALLMEGGVVYRLSTGLWRRYPLFTLMFSAGLVQHVAIRVLPSLYRSLWITTTPLLILLQIAAAYEVYRLWCACWPGRSGYGSVLAAGTAVGVAALAGFSLAPAPKPVLWIVEIQRDVAFVLALALIVTIRVFWIRSRWPRSLLVHTGVMIGWYAFVALTWVVISVGHDQWRITVNDTTNWGRIALLAIWAIWMRADTYTPAPPDLDAAQKEQQAIATDLQAAPPGPEAFLGQLASPAHSANLAIPASLASTG